MKRHKKWKNEHVGQHMISGYDRHVILEIGQLKMLVLYCHSFMGELSKWFNGELQAHFSFFALTEGWQSFSESGLESLYLAHTKKELINDEEIKRQAKEIVYNNGFVMPEVVQQSLF